jgi:DNA-directed RNA polymerase specialized sigma24 family protein
MKPMVLERPEADSVKKDLEGLYETAFPVVARFVSRMGGSFQDARDIFHDAMVIFWEKDQEQTIRGEPAAYILGIAKHLWFRNFNVQKHRVSFTDEEMAITVPDDYFPGVNETYLFQVIRLTGKKCMEILHAFYYAHEPMKKVAQVLGYHNSHSATVQKYKCLEKIREHVKTKSLGYEDFLE